MMEVIRVQTSKLMRFLWLALVILSLAIDLPFAVKAKQLPLVINTWPVPSATAEAWSQISRGSSAVEAVVKGCSKCEELQCRGSVGYGGKPDEHGETTLDAMIMNGATMEVGSVGDLRRIKNAIGVAHAVMMYSKHTLIVGESAKEFAKGMGFVEEDLSTNKSFNDWRAWERNNCQPNFRKNVVPDPTLHCGPYRPAENVSSSGNHDIMDTGPDNHDTIGMVVVDSKGNVASGTSTNGLNHKIPGRVGDSPIVGAGSYASNAGGGAAATGNGDIMMRFLPSFHAVMEMEKGASPREAATLAFSRMTKFYPDFSGAIIAANTKGEYGVACYGYESHTFCVQSPADSKVEMVTVLCLQKQGNSSDRGTVYTVLVIVSSLMSLVSLF
ncbi:N(4)-(Beta-N-acetylglucosaminyl)-L-asparaginase [Aplysia californica]|uniref:N(4)-(Beta-N-acetylglucosaminyl)-L-asparaginase n=1 Tax=Aplysia californica TaxID=6500 RepID=A0ABM0JGH3_APLCA|nr:N(4)-(Beta-N-acetylglucosaminyl)-L-asparaginase [Aplysia californica]